MFSGGRSCRNRGCSPHRVSTSSPATVAITLTNLISVPVGLWGPGIAVGGETDEASVATGAAVPTSVAGGASPAKIAVMAGIVALAQSVAAEEMCASPAMPIALATLSPKSFNISSFAGLSSVTRNRYRS